MNLRSFYFSFDGRVARSTYWKYFLGPVIVIYVLVSLYSSPVWFDKALFTTWLVLLWPSIAVSAKRCHDRDQSGWRQLAGLIPIVGPAWLFIELGFLPGTGGDNRYGPVALTC